MSDYTPHNDDAVLHISCGAYGMFGHSLAELIEMAQAHFGADIDLNDFQITAEHIHTDHIGYDLYDSSDYTNYLVISRK